jgi:hypothetical protein
LSNEEKADVPRAVEVEHQLPDHFPLQMELMTRAEQKVLIDHRYPEIVEKSQLVQFKDSLYLHFPLVA